MKRIPALMLTCILGVLCHAAEPAAKVEPHATKKVMEVETVTVSILESLPEQLSIEATGTVNSGGWKNPALVSVKSDEEGVLVFDFVAVPPDGMATQALMPVKASIKVVKPANFKEVKVVSHTNTKSAK